MGEPRGSESSLDKQAAILRCQANVLMQFLTVYNHFFFNDWTKVQAFLHITETI